MADQIILTPEEQTKFNIINAAIQKQTRTGQAAKMLGITPRQIQRLKKAVRRDGLQAVIHKLKNKVSNHHIALSIKENVLQKIKTQYHDFKPTFATEKLKECHNLLINRETLRLWMIEKELWKSRKQKKTGYRSWRPRKDYYGEMQQFDGSYHDWFEGRYCDLLGNIIETCLLLAIDDATGKITKAYFALNEGVVAVFVFWKTYIEVNGKPTIIYLDQFSTYKINHKNAVDNKELMTQFERACKDLGIQLINAQSAEAKGRVERCFGTLQDRLVKELRLTNINSPNEANILLEKVFIPKFNEKFSVVPTKAGNIHRDLTDKDRYNINRIFSVQSCRKVNNDFTIKFKNNWYQLEEIQPTTVRPKEAVLVEEWLDGSLHLSLREQYLKYILLSERPRKMKTNPVIITAHKLNWKPPVDHPWRTYRNRL